MNDPKLTQLVAAQRQEPDPKKRREIMRQAIRYLNETALGIAIDRAPNAVFWHPYVKNYAPHQDHGYASINAWLDK